ncbi:DUF397 domain-containing protein [Nocardiopsis dassonvillei]|uniref:DUF397 domain-containing protein n=1 Tax=Nocardiopsis dassonvillei TaxID=2014 RepID=UPI00362FD213
MSSSIPTDLFRKSSYSQIQNCVEVADLPTGSAVRDTQHREQGHLMFSPREWSQLVTTVKTSQG